MSEETRKAPIRKTRVELTGEYAGWWFDARVNPRMSTFSMVTSGDIDRLIEALSQLILAWNFVDEDGEPLPEPYKDTAAIGSLASDLFNLVADSYVKAVTNLAPN